MVKTEMVMSTVEAVNRISGQPETLEIETGCVITLDGQTFESGGAWISESHLSAYYSKGKVTTWAGDILSDKVLVVGRGSWGDTRIRFEYKGKIWAGRVIVNGDLLYAKPTKFKTLRDY
jgi:hypothetical protein